MLSIWSCLIRFLSVKSPLHQRPTINHLCNVSVVVLVQSGQAVFITDLSKATTYTGCCTLHLVVQEVCNHVHVDLTQWRCLGVRCGWIFDWGAFLDLWLVTVSVFDSWVRRVPGLFSDINIHIWSNYNSFALIHEKITASLGVFH